MASEDDEIEEIEEELDRVEREIQKLEQEDQPPAPDAPDPEAEDVEAPPPEQAFEGEPDVEIEQGPISRLISRFSSEEETEQEDEAEEGPPDEPEPEEATDPETDGDETQETEEESEGGFLSRLGGTSEEDETEAGDDETEELEEETDEEQEPRDEEGGLLSRLTRPFRSEEEDDSEEEEDATTGDEEPDEDVDESPEPVDDEPDEDAREADEEGSAQADKAPPEDPNEPPEDEAAPEPGEEGQPDGEASGDEDEEDRTRAAALLARFRKGGEGEDQAPPEPDEEEDEDRRGIAVGVILLLLLLLVAAVVGAYVWTQNGGTGGQPLAAELVADSIQNDQGSYVATTGQAIQLDASESQGEVREYRWTFGDGEETTTSEPTAEHTYTQTGSYTVQLVVVGSSGTVTAQIPVLVIEAPSASLELLHDGATLGPPGDASNPVFVGEPVTLDGSSSSADPDHAIASYTWDTNGDGAPEATGQTAQLSFDEAGRWIVNLTVRDDLGNEDSQQRAVHVSDRLNQTGTIGPSTTEPDTESVNVSVVPARLGATPVQLDLRLTYNSSSNDTGGVLGSGVDPDLDLNVTAPDGTVYAAEDDSGEGSENLTIPQSDLAPLGLWTVNVQQDTQSAGTVSEAEYQLVVETLY